MYLTKHATAGGPRWALDGIDLPLDLSLSGLLKMERSAMLDRLQARGPDEPAQGALLAPIDAMQEVWACGVTYLRSREARRAESQVGDVYQRVYDAERPELFFKCAGWRAVGPGADIRIRRDSRWNVPEPELTLVINRSLEIVGYCAGNDVSSRDIEGENPLYLPQAKVYDGSCALGPGILLAEAGELADVPIRLTITRQGAAIFEGETSTGQMKRQMGELVAYLGRELSLPHGALLMTGTGLVPPDNITLTAGDVTRIEVGPLALENTVAN